MQEQETSQPVQRVSEVLTPWITAALREHVLGDRVLWESSLAMTPSGPAVLLVVYLPGLVLGTSIQGHIALTNPFAITRDAVYALVQQTLEALRAQRSQEAAMSHDPPPGPSLNGHGRSG